MFSSIILCTGYNSKYANRIIFKFKESKKIISSNNLKVNYFRRDVELKNILAIFNDKYGQYKISKLLPYSSLADSIIVNKQNGKKMRVPNKSLIFNIDFEKAVPVDSIINQLYKCKNIEYAQGPLDVQFSVRPNDYFFQNGNCWAFSKIQAEDAWELSNGDSSVVIAIIDKFNHDSLISLHEDLIGKVNKHFNKFGGHGIQVAGVAASNTNNIKGVASLGWNLRLNFYDITYPVKAIYDAIEDDVDVINFSFYSRANLSYMRDAVKTALARGIVCVGAAGNDNTSVPDTAYPAAYNFNGIGQVIAVSATKMDGEEEKFVDGWNYSPGNDPLNDPISSFIDVAAPGYNITVLDKSICNNYSNACGTSLSTPFVSALAGLLLSVNRNLSLQEIYNIIVSTTDKIGQYEYENGWNQYLGYGRINAFKALNSICRISYTKKESSIPQMNEQHKLKNFPNPFNGKTNIVLVVTKKEKISLSVFNLLGELVDNLVDEVLSPGNYKFEFVSFNYLNKLSSGVFLIRLNSKTSTQTLKIVHVK